MICTKCGEDKSEDAYYHRHGKPLRRCKACVCAQTKQWQQDNPERYNARLRKWKADNPERRKEHQRKSANRPGVQQRNRLNNLRARYGLTPAEYDALLVAQGGVCAICGEACSSGQRLSVYHSHKTGRVRGLLCRDHNLMLGLAPDDPARLRAAADYLEQHGALK
jgi:hypothetical protein